MFGHMIRNRRFQKHITPIVAEYRRQYRMRNATPPTSSSSSDDSSPQTFLSVRNSIPGSPVSTVDPKFKDGHDSPPTPGSSSSHPIDIDNLVCDRCKEIGHISDNCNAKKFLPTCERCSQFGHEKPDCDTKIRSFIFCDICNWEGKPQSMHCGHYDFSPTDGKLLRGDRIPFG